MRITAYCCVISCSWVATSVTVWVQWSHKCLHFNQVNCNFRQTTVMYKFLGDKCIQLRNIWIFMLDLTKCMYTQFLLQVVATTVVWIPLVSCYTIIWFREVIETKSSGVEINCILKVCLDFLRGESSNISKKGVVSIRSSIHSSKCVVSDNAKLGSKPSLRTCLAHYTGGCNEPKKWDEYLDLHVETCYQYTLGPL